MPPSRLWKCAVCVNSAPLRLDAVITDAPYILTRSPKSCLISTDAPYALPGHHSPPEALLRPYTVITNALHSLTRATPTPMCPVTKDSPFTLPRSTLTTLTLWCLRDVNPLMLIPKTECESGYWIRSENYREMNWSQPLMKPLSREARVGSLVKRRSAYTSDHRIFIHSLDNDKWLLLIVFNSSFIYLILLIVYFWFHSCKHHDFFKEKNTTKLFHCWALLRKISKYNSLKITCFLPLHVKHFRSMYMWVL